jgi:hypothetical protein
MATSVFEFRDLGRTAPTAVRVYMDDSLGQARLVPANELWLWQNRRALRAVQTGLAEMSRGETAHLGSFAAFADVDVDGSDD